MIRMLRKVPDTRQAPPQADVEEPLKRPTK